eukprot:6756191-Pyramimonas_sp.AAC.1
MQRSERGCIFGCAADDSVSHYLLACRPLEALVRAVLSRDVPAGTLVRLGLFPVEFAPGPSEGVIECRYN